MMKERRQSEKARLESLLRITRYQAKSMQDLLDYVLDEAIDLTQSEIGYIFFYNGKKRQFILNSWSHGVMDVCKISEQQTVFDLDKTGIWGEAVRQARPVVINDFAAPHPLKKGYPEGHAPLKRFMTVPVFSEGSIVAVLGLANKETDYLDVDIQQASLLMSSLWQMAERKRIEDVLARSQQMLNQVINTLPVRISWKDVDLAYLGCNKRFARDAGLKDPGEIIGKTDEDLAWSAQADQYKAHDLEVLSSGLPKVGYEEEVSLPHGSKLWMRKHKVPLNDADGKVVGLLGTYEDITGIKKDQLRIARLAAIVDASEDAIIGATPDGIVTDWNRGAEKIYGYTALEILGKSLLVLASPDKQGEVTGILDDLRQGKHINHYETRHMRKGGENFYIWLTISPILDDHRLTGLSMIGRDVTQRKTSEAEQERYRNFIENISDGCFEIDLQGNIIFANEAMEERMGYSRGGMIGVNNRLYASADSSKRIYGIFKRIYQTGEPADINDYAVKNKLGQIRYVDLSASLIRDVHGKPVGFRGTTRDITDRKIIKDDLERSEARYRNLFQYNKAVMLLIDPDTAQIVDANLAACYYYQYSKNELLHKKITDINVLNHEEMCAEMDLARLEERSHFYFSHRLANGEIHPVEVFTGPVEIGGKQLLYSIVHDITERRKTEQALRESEERYRTILETISEGYLEHDLAGNFLFVNDAACHLAGYKREEIIGMNYRRIVSEDTARKMYPQYNSIYKTGKSETLLDFEVIRPDGSRVIVELNAMLMRNGFGEPIGFRVMARDVTARRQAEEGLRQSEERYRSVLENISEGYFESNLQGDIVFVNDAGCAMLGYDREVLYQINYRQFTTPESNLRLQAAYRNVFQTGIDSKMADYEIIRGDGSARVHQLTVGLITDDGGVPLGFRAVARDITEQKASEEALRRSEEKYRTIMETIMEGYIEHDLEGRFIFANDYACAMMGYTREELLQMNYRQIVAPQAARYMERIARDIIATGIPRKLVDYAVVCKDGTVRIHQHNLSLIRDAAGAPTGLRVMARDVTELKKIEADLRYSEERSRILFNNIPVPTFVWKAQGEQFILAEFNGAAFQFIGDDIVNFMGKTANQFFSGMPQIPADIRKCLALQKTVENQFWYAVDDRSEKRYVMVKYAFAAPDSVLMHVNDITGQKRAEENLQYISVHDSLTGLYNRFYADAEIMRLASSRLRPVSVIIIDLNDLKKVNDEYGHAHGDLYIKNAATLLQQTFRPEDMTARIGGDEFMVLLPFVDEDTCAQAVARLHENIGLFNAKNEQPISLSAGCATAHVGDSLMDRMREADRRMYVEKANMKATGQTLTTH